MYLVRLCRSFIGVRMLIRTPTRTVAITPGRSVGQDFAEVKRICQDCTMAGLKAMYEAGPSKPFRFVYLSGEGTPRDMTKKPFFLGQYLLMRVSKFTLYLCFAEFQVRKIYLQIQRARQKTWCSNIVQSMQASRFA